MSLFQIILCGIANTKILFSYHFRYFIVGRSATVLTVTENEMKNDEK